MRRLALALPLALLALATPRIADACSCIQSPGPIPAASDAGAVFEGKILSIADAPAQGDGLGTMPMKVYTVEVLRTWKGTAKVGDKVKIQTADNSAACGRAYEKGVKYLMYVQNADGGDFSDNLCSRTMKSDQASADFEALGEADGAWEAPEDAGGDAGADAGADGPNEEAPTEPAIDPFAPKDEGGEVDPEGAPSGDGAPAQPQPAEGSSRGCSVDASGDLGGAAALALLLPLAWRRRRR